MNSNKLDSSPQTALGLSSCPQAAAAADMSFFEGFRMSVDSTSSSTCAVPVRSRRISDDLMWDHSFTSEHSILKAITNDEYRDDDNEAVSVFYLPGDLDLY